MLIVDNSRRARLWRWLQREKNVLQKARSARTSGHEKGLTMGIWNPISAGKQQICHEPGLKDLEDHERQLTIYPRCVDSRQ